MGVFDREYQAQASYCMQMADRALTDELRQDWLRLAEKWLHMVNGSKRQSSQSLYRAARDCEPSRI